MPIFDYAQPLTGLISALLGLPPRLTGLLVTLPLAGYRMGLLIIVPLGNQIENRGLVLTLIGIETLCLVLISLIAHANAFLGIAFLMGAMAAAVQVLVPYATYLAPKERRGQAVGRVVSGVMLGIMWARPVSSLVTDLWSWQAIFRISAVLMAALCHFLRRRCGGFRAQRLVLRQLWLDQCVCPRRLAPDLRLVVSRD